MLYRSLSSSDQKTALANRNIKLIIEFDGTDFHGWQVQKKVRTVQGELEAVLSKGLKQDDIDLIGCSRTDAGVHANMYCAGFGYEGRHTPETIKNIANSLLSDDISILKAEEVSNSFNARHSVRSKTYLYKILNTSDFHPLERRFSWHIREPMSISDMAESAKVIEGRHDFSAFCGALEKGVSPERDLDAISVETRGEKIFIYVKARSFLYRMVRIIAGTLADAGSGRISCTEVRDILESKDKNRMRQAAPARGLFLYRVEY